MGSSVCPSVCPVPQHNSRTERPTDKTGTPIEHALYQLPRSAIKAYEVGFLHAGGGIPCRPHPAATQFVSIY